MSAGLDNGHADIVAITSAGDMFRFNDNDWQSLGARQARPRACRPPTATASFVVGGDQTVLEFDDLNGWFALTGSNFAQWSTPMPS